MTSVDSDYGEAFQRVLDALKSVGSSVTVNGNTAMAQCPCPAHRDENPSLSITDVEGRVLLKCHAECDPEDVIAALTLRWADLFDSAARGVANGARPVSIAEYVYTDERGEPLFRVVRYEPKGFRQHRWNGTSWSKR